MKLNFKGQQALDFQQSYQLFKRFVDEPEFTFEDYASLLLTMGINQVNDKNHNQKYIVNEFRKLKKQKQNEYKQRD